MDSKVKGTLADGTEYTVRPALNPDAPRWPQVEGHVWNAFPQLAIETGGYHDLEAYDPFTGRMIWTRAFQNPDGTAVNIYDGLRRLIDVMEAAGFLDEPSDGGPAPDSGSTPAGSPPDGLGDPNR